MLVMMGVSVSAVVEAVVEYVISGVVVESLSLGVDGDAVVLVDVGLPVLLVE